MNLYIRKINETLTNTIMSVISDLISKQVQATAGNVEVPSNIKDQILGGLSDSILGSLTKTATQPGGIDIVKNLLTGKANAATSPVTELAGKLFAGNILSKFNLGQQTNNALTGLIPSILSKASGFVKDQDGDGDVDINDIIIALTGKKQGGGILGAATSILGGFLKKK